MNTFDNDRNTAKESNAIVFITLLFFSLVFLNACSMSRGDNELTEITVLSQGKNIKQRPEMVEACKGFFISAQQFKDFYYYSALTHEAKTNINNKKLPCYSSGTAYLGDKEFKWILRSGGIAEFYNEQKSFTKICGVSCCKKVQGVC
jgi:hypothetical protein